MTGRHANLIAWRLVGNATAGPALRCIALSSAAGDTGVDDAGHEWHDDGIMMA